MAGVGSMPARCQSSGRRSACVGNPLHPSLPDSAARRRGAGVEHPGITPRPRGKGSQLMTWSSRACHALLAPSAKLFVAGALIYAGLIAPPAMAVGYPAPGGIYSEFTDCPLHNQEMRLAGHGLAMGCIKSLTQSGTFKINGKPVASTHHVKFQ